MMMMLTRRRRKLITCTILMEPYRPNKPKFTKQLKRSIHGHKIGFCVSQEAVHIFNAKRFVMINKYLQDRPTNGCNTNTLFI